jgi:hypothetical protein
LARTAWELRSTLFYAISTRTSNSSARFTDSPFPMIAADAHHHDHAQAEQVFADWNKA